MKIDIDRLTERELIDLNHRIVAHLLLRADARSFADAELPIGDRVSFQPHGQGPVEGVLARYNGKTVTIIADDGRQWNVSPHLLHTIRSPVAPGARGSDVVLVGRALAGEQE